MKWISVEDRVPEAGTEVLGWVPAYNDFNRYEVRKVVYYSRTGSGQYMTHWMPLPTPPAGEG